MTVSERPATKSDDVSPAWHRKERKAGAKDGCPLRLHGRRRERRDGVGFHPIIMCHFCETAGSLLFLRTTGCVSAKLGGPTVPLHGQWYGVSKQRSTCDSSPQFPETCAKPGSCSGSTREVLATVLPLQFASSALRAARAASEDMSKGVVLHASLRLRLRWRLRCARSHVPAVFLHVRFAGGWTCPLEMCPKPFSSFDSSQGLGCVRD